MGLSTSSGLRVGRGSPGPRNLISDVPGVTVGHVTIRDGAGVNTGVTAVLPHQGDLFRDKVLAASAVINGFGKTAGLIQVEELGTIETPIVLTNTLSVGTAYTALVKYAMARNPDIGRTAGTVNPLVCECNDGSLNDIRGLHVTEEHVLAAIESAKADFAEGSVGGGTGMSCLGFKGGIGSASRVAVLDGFTDLEGNRYYQQVKTLAEQEGAQVLPICAKLEQDVAELEGEERQMFLEELGVEESGLDRLIKCSYTLLGLISFLTYGKDECRAWTIQKGTKAPRAAGKIHTDIERGFIRAEVIAYEDMMKCGSVNAAKEKGLLRSEGKEYVVQDGDMIYFRFNV